MNVMNVKTNPLLERFNANAHHRQTTMEVTIDNYGNQETYTIMPMDFIDNMRGQSKLKITPSDNFKNEGGDIVILGNVAAREMLNAIATYVMEFRQITELDIKVSACGSMDEFIQGVLSDTAISELYHKIQKLTVEIRKAAEVAAFEAAEKATD